jgi:hypothetical protein
MDAKLLIVASVAAAIAFAAEAPRAVTFNAVTFNKDVLPILQRNCQICHRP